MSDAAGGNLLIVQSGGPTAVINCTLEGAIRQAMRSSAVDQILGARFGIRGVLNDSFIDLRRQPRSVLEGLVRTPGAALGSSRDKLEARDCPRVLDMLDRRGVRYLLYNGGNGSMHAARELDRLVQDRGGGLRVIGVPKTIDNDLTATDRCPGFGSAARYVAQSVRDLGMDLRALPTPVSIFEAMGRDAGWLAGAAALAKTDADSAPHLIYTPERAFDGGAFLSALDKVVGRLGWAVVVVSEGLCDAGGRAVFQAAETSQRDAVGRALPGDVGGHLARLVTRELGLRCRSEKPGLCGRSSLLCVSPPDQDDARAVGRAAVDAATSGRRGEMVTLLPRGSADEPPRTGLAPLEDVAQAVRLLPDGWLDASRPFITRAFEDYLRPILGPPLLDYVRLQ